MLHTKLCTKCDEEKDISEFYPHPHCKLGVDAKCKECTKARKRKVNRYEVYGLTEEEYVDMLAIQKNRCAICKTPFDFDIPKNIHIDHCHDTKDVRGILCRDCNIGLGHFKDSPERLVMASQYLTEF